MRSTHALLNGPSAPLSEEHLIMQQCILADDVAYDIGANAGVYRSGCLKSSERTERYFPSNPILHISDAWEKRSRCLRTPDCFRSALRTVKVRSHSLYRKMTRWRVYVTGRTVTADGFLNVLSGNDDRRPYRRGRNFGSGLCQMRYRRWRTGLLYRRAKYF